MNQPPKTTSELSPKQQAIELLRSSGTCWIVTHKSPDGDAVGSSLALARVLEELGKTVRVFAYGKPPAEFGFLAEVDRFEEQLPDEREVIFELPLQTHEHAQLLYSRQDDGALRVVVRTAGEEFKKEDMKVTIEEMTPSLLIILDAADLQVLGPLAERIRGVLEKTTSIAIDHHSSNRGYATIDVIDQAATSTAEILVGVIEALQGKTSLFDVEVATALLLGLLTDTGSFQNQNTTPKSLTVAAQLVALGAHQQMIIRQVFRTKSLPKLRLWGRALLKLQFEPNGRFLWSEVSQSDFLETGASDEELSGVIDELMKAVPGARFVLLLSERKLGLNGSMRSIEESVNVAEVAHLFGGGGHTAAAGFLLLGETLASQREQILTRIRRQIAESESTNTPQPGV